MNRVTINVIMKSYEKYFMELLSNSNAIFSSVVVVDSLVVSSSVVVGCLVVVDSLVVVGCLEVVGTAKFCNFRTPTPNSRLVSSPQRDKGAGNGFKRRMRKFCSHF